MIMMVCTASVWGGVHAARADVTPEPEAPLCLEIPAADHLAIALHPEDNKSLALAEAFRDHLALQGKDPAIINALYKASIKTGVDFELLLLKAIMESDLGRLTVAAHSTARGVFQYIEPTWLILISRHGKALGYPQYQEAVQISRKTGNPYLNKRDEFLRSEILALRHDPEVSAQMKALQIIEETEVIRSLKKKKEVTATDHYIAHMLGLNLAHDFYNMINKGSPLAVAKLNKPEMREATKLNKQFFFEKGHALNAAESYDRFTRSVKRELASIEKVGALPYTPPCGDIVSAALQ